MIGRLHPVIAPIALWAGCRPEPVPMHRRLRQADRLLQPAVRRRLALDSALRAVVHRRHPLDWAAGPAG